MSCHHGLRINPVAVIAKVIFGGTSAYTIVTTFVAGLRAFIMVAGQGSETLIFACENYVLYLAIVLGIVFVLFVDYFLEWQEYQKKHPDEVLKFDIKYVVAALCTMLVSAIITYLCVFYGAGYIAEETIIQEVGLCFVIAFFASGVITYVVDACIFKRVCDGTMAALKVKSQKAIREALESEAAKKALFNAIADKAKALGLVSDKKIEALAGLVGDKGVDDPNFALYAQMLQNTPEQ